MFIDTTARSLNADGMMGEKDSKDTINDMNIRNSVGTMGAAASTEDSVPMFQLYDHIFMHTILKSLFVL